MEIVAAAEGLASSTILTTIQATNSQMSPLQEAVRVATDSSIRETQALLQEARVFSLNRTTSNSNSSSSSSRLSIRNSSQERALCLVNR